MMIFFKKRDKNRIDELDSKLNISFNRVKYDTDVVFQWLNYFHDKMQDQDVKILSQYEEIAALKETLKDLPKTKEEIRKIVDEHYALKAILERIHQIEERIKQRPTTTTRPVRAKIEQIKASATTALQDKVMKKITRNSKDYIKSIILSMINKYDQISALELRDMLVEDQKLCSKSSFYRILEELEKEHSIQRINKGKEKIYSSITIQR